LQRLDTATVIRALILGILLGIMLVGALGGGMVIGQAILGPRMLSPLQPRSSLTTWLAFLLVWPVSIGGVSLLAAVVVRQINAALVSMSPTDRALDILRERYAKGEISREQFQEARQVLESRSS
jgi:putative membrane protein